MTTATANPGDPFFPITVEQYHQMIRHGIFSEDDPIELLEGRLINKMSKNPPHSVATDLVAEALRKLSLPGCERRLRFVSPRVPFTYLITIK